MLLSKDLTNKQTLSLSKALLGNVCPSLSEYEVYSKYFGFFTLADSDTNLSCIKSRPEMLRKVTNSMYCVRRPSQDPAFFSFESFHDLCRLSTLLKTEIVVYSGQNDKLLEEVELFHDFRRMRDPSNPVTYFLVTRAKRLFKIDAGLDHLVSYPYMHDKTESLQEGLSWGPVLSRLTDLPEPPFNLGQDIQTLVAFKEKLFELWQEPVIMVLLGKSKNLSKTNACRRKLPKSHHFVSLCLIGPPLDKMSDLNLMSVKKVVCFFASTKVGLLNETFRASVIADLIHTVHKDRPSGQDLLNLPSLSKATVAQAREDLKAKKTGMSLEPS